MFLSYMFYPKRGCQSVTSFEACQCLYFLLFLLTNANISLSPCDGYKLSEVTNSSLSMWGQPAHFLRSLWQRTSRTSVSVAWTVWPLCFLPASSLLVLHVRPGLENARKECVGLPNAQHISVYLHAVVGLSCAISPLFNSLLTVQGSAMTDVWIVASLWTHIFLTVYFKVFASSNASFWCIDR